MADPLDGEFSRLPDAPDGPEAKVHSRAGRLCGACGEFWAGTWEDVRDLGQLALPITFSAVAMMGMEIISVAAAAHLGVVALDAAGLARVLANCSGLAPVIGLVMAMDTLATQAHGAANFPLVGDIAQRAILISGLVCIPIIALWWNVGPLLHLLRQDPEVIPLAQTYLRWYSLGIIPRAVVEVMNKFLQAQGIVYPTLAIMLIVLVFHGLVTYSLIWPLAVGFYGVPLSLCLSYVFQIALTALYIRFGAQCCRRWTSADPAACWDGVSRRAFQGWGPFLRLGVPGALLICLDWWAFEIVMVEAGMLGIAPLAAASVTQQLLVVLYRGPLGVSSATAGRGGQHLGSGRPAEARRTARSGILANGVVGTLTATAIACGLPLWSRGFTDDPVVAESVAAIRFPVALISGCDAMSVALAGVLRGTGHQAWGAGIMFLGQWGVGLPLGTCAGFLWGFGLAGIYGGLLCGTMLVPPLDGFVVHFLNWPKASVLARQRSGSFGFELSDLSGLVVPTGD